MRYTMTEKQHAKIMEACKPVPMIMLQCGEPSSPQENANRAWESLGRELGFDSKTVRPVRGEPDRVFTADWAPCYACPKPDEGFPPCANCNGDPQ